MAKAGRPALPDGKKLVRQVVMLPPDVRDALAAKAADAGVGIGAYARDVLTRHARRK